MFNFKNKRRGGVILSFTLAEVLITLTIIGVVAAMTVPLLTANHKKIEYAAKLKKFYNTMTSAIEMAEMDYDASTDKWTFTGNGDIFFNTYLKDYIKYTKIVTSKQSDTIPFYLTPKKTSYWAISNKQPIVYLEDGTRMQLILDGTYTDSKTSKTKRYLRIGFDVNGDKEPNVINRDIFILSFAQKGFFQGIDTNSLMGVAPNLKFINQSRKTLIDKCAETCAKNNKPEYCFVLMKNDGWEFKKDYPCKL